MSQESVSSPLTDRASPTICPPPRAAAGAPCGRRRPRDDLLLPASGLPGPVAGRVQRLAGRPVLRAFRSLAAAAAAADRRPRARHASDDALRPGADSGGRLWAGWALRRSTAARAWAPTCSGRPRAGWRSAGRWWACCGPRSPTFSAAPAGRCADRRVTAAPTPGRSWPGSWTAA